MTPPYDGDQEGWYGNGERLIGYWVEQSRTRWCVMFQAREDWNGPVVAARYQQKFQAEEHARLNGEWFATLTDDQKERLWPRTPVSDGSLAR